MSKIGDNAGDKTWRVVVEFENRIDAEDCYQTLRKLWYEPDLEELTVQGIFSREELENG